MFVFLNGKHFALVLVALQKYYQSILNRGESPLMFVKPTSLPITVEKIRQRIPTLLE